MLPQDFPGLPPIDIRSGFFRFEFPKNVEDLEDFIARLQAHEENYIRNPILPPYNLKLTARLDGHKISFSPGKRIIPELITHTAFKQLDALQLVLTRPIEVGERKWSQVWQGALTSWLAPAVAPAPVAVKIYQESLFPYGPDIPDLLGDDDEWRPGAMTAAMEAYAFDKMRELQGEIVPWSYGFFKVLLPNGESAFAHVMELIEGIPALSDHATVESFQFTDKDIWDLADNLCIALHRIHSCGFIHRDFDAKNFIFLEKNTADSHLSRKFVVVDFGLIRTFHNVNKRDVLEQMDAAGVRFILEEIDVSKDTIVAWNEARRSESPAWRTMFSFIDDWGGLY